MAEPVSHERIMKIGFGFWASKVLFSAIELGVFSELAKAPADGATLTRRFGLNGRGAADFFGRHRRFEVEKCSYVSAHWLSLDRTTRVKRGLRRVPADPPHWNHGAGFDLVLSVLPTRNVITNFLQELQSSSGLFF